MPFPKREALTNQQGIDRVGVKYLEFVISAVETNGINWASII